MSTLTDLFTNIANAIRAKTGSQEIIQASDFPTEIANIPSGGEYNIKGELLPNAVVNDNRNLSYSITEVSNITVPEGVTSLRALFSLFVSLNSVPVFDTSMITIFSSMFNTCLVLTNPPLLDTSNGTDFISMFNSCVNLTAIPNYDVSKGLNFNSMFSGCSKLVDAPSFQFSNTTEKNFKYMFSYCRALENVPEYNLTGAKNMQGMFSDCTALTTTSLNNILASLLTAVNYTGTKTLAYIGLSSTQATTCTTLSNWQALSDAGWTTGY